jgi:hypothetical protein
VVFEALDYVYMPSRDVAVDVRYFTEVLGGRLIFAIDGMGAKVAMIELTEGPPALLLADHLAGDGPILVYRVADLAAAAAELATRGWEHEHELEIPQGPVSTFRAPGQQRLAIYQRSRPGVIESFAGRRDF